jgi:hypothetical protein
MYVVCVRVLTGKPERDFLGDLSIDGKIIFKEKCNHVHKFCAVELETVERL